MPVLAGEVRGAAAQDLRRPGAGARPALIDAVWAPGGEPRLVFDIRINNGKIVAIELAIGRLSGPELVRDLDLTILGDEPESGNG